MNKFVLLTIDLQGPVKTDLSFINGSSIRGAYIKTYINKNNISEDISLNEEYRRTLLSKDIKFYDAYPMIDGKYSIPTPLCFYASKDDMKEFSRDKNEIDISNEFYTSIGEGYQRVNKSDFSILDNDSINLVSINRLENLHNCKQKDTENIFRYEAIDKNQQFYSVIQCEEDLVKDVKSIFKNEIVYIGGSRTGGYGRCKVRIEGIYDLKELKDKLNITFDSKQKPFDFEEDKEILNIYFISDTILKDENGNLVSYIPEDKIEQDLGIQSVKLEKASILTRELKGYNAMWKSFTPIDTAIKAGSIISYSYKGKLDLDKVNEFEIKGLGSKKSEGYGRIAINPKLSLNKCRSYNKNEISDKNNKKMESTKLSKESQSIMENILNNINKYREDEYIDKILIESIDTKTDSRGTKKVMLDKLTAAQKGRLINMTNEALEKLELQGELYSKNYISKFTSEIKTKTKDQFRDKSKINLFDCSVFEYIDKVIDSNVTFNQLTGIDNKVKYTSLKGIKTDRNSDYKMKLLLTKKLISFTLRKKGDENNER